MLTGQQLFDIRFIDESTGDLTYFIPPQMVVGMKMEKVINGIGNLVFTCPYSDELWEAYSLDRLVEVKTWNPHTQTLESENTYILRGRERYYEGGYQQIAYFCVGLEHLLTRRMVKPTTDDDTNAGGFVTRAGAADVVFGEFIDEQIVSPEDTNRAFTYVTFARRGGGEQVGIRVRYDNLFDVLNRVRQTGEIEFKITRTTANNLLVEAGALSEDQTYSTNYPFSPSMFFSPLLGNALDPLFKEDSKEVKNFIFGLGEGEGSNQLVLEVNGNGLTESVYSRIEDVAESTKGEGNNTNASQQLLTTALQKLSDSRKKEDYEFRIPTTPSSEGYREIWDIGDKVTFYWDNIQAEFQIKGTTLTVSNANVTRTIKLELENG